MIRFNVAAPSPDGSAIGSDVDELDEYEDELDDDQRRTAHYHHTMPFAASNPTHLYHGGNRKQTGIKPTNTNLTADSLYHMPPSHSRSLKLTDGRGVTLTADYREKPITHGEEQRLASSDPGDTKGKGRNRDKDEDSEFKPKKKVHSPKSPCF